MTNYLEFFYTYAIKDAIKHKILIPNDTYSYILKSINLDKVAQKIRLKRT